MEKKSKLVLAVLQGSDSDNTIRNLNEHGFMVTLLSSTGGFLKKKSTTVMIGVEAERLEEAMENWTVLIANIRKECPEMEIYIQSATPVYPSFEGKKLNNANLELYNARLKSFAAQKGCVYVDVARYLKDENGALAARYCSDRQCHLTESGVQVWLRVLKEVAAG